MENLNLGKDNEEWRSGIKERRIDNLNWGINREGENEEPEWRKGRIKN